MSVNVDVKHSYNETNFKSLNEETEANKTPEAEELHLD
jgi:hypothetical protein